MTNEERDLIARFVSRVGGAPQTGGFLSGSGSVPQSQPALPPLDKEADGFITQQFQQYPEARYRITQTAIVQEAALAEATNRIRRLEWELEQQRQAVQQAPQQNKGFFGSLFGGGSQQQPQGRPGFGGQPGYGGPTFQPSSPPPQPQYPPSYQPGMFQRGGSGFLGSALTTAAGVAGGMVVGNALMNAFSGHGAGSAMAAGGASPWDSSGVSPSDPTGGFLPDQSAGGGDPFGGSGFGNAPEQGGDPFGGGGFDQASADPGGFDNGGGFGGFGGGGFDDNQA